MAGTDLSDINSAESVKVIGSDLTGVETFPINSTPEGDQHNSPVNRRLNASASISALNGDLYSSTDVSQYKSACIQLTGTWSATVTFQASNNNVAFVSVGALNLNDPASSAGNTATANGMYHIPVFFKFLRIRVTAYTSGTVVGTTLISSMQPFDLSARFVDIKSGQLVPTITNKFRIRSNVGDININPTYTTMFTRLGVGLFFGFQASFNHAEIIMKLTLDGGVVFELNLNDIRQFKFNDTTTTRTQMGGFLTTIGNVLDFSSKFAIPYSTDLTIEMKSVTGTRKNTNWIVFLTED
ncbi:MAG: hypothetical protein SGI96_21130 [Bacteroidota bacterium]|nr:hypothetical protein [Bacteroidota bacterium]